MHSSAGDPSYKSQEDLADVEYLKKLWDEEKGSFFDALAEAKTGVWTYCPPHYRVYMKTLYLDRQGKVITCTYCALDVFNPLIKLEASTLTDIEKNGKARVSWSEGVADASYNKVIVNVNYSDGDEKKTSIEITAPMPVITRGNTDSFSVRSFGNRYYSSKQLYVFSEFKVGEQPGGSVKLLDEMSFDVTLADLWVAEREADILSGGSYFSKRQLKDILSSDWVSRSVKDLNRIAFEYKAYNEEGDRKGISKEIIKEELSVYLRIRNKQKLKSAFDIAVGTWSAYRKGIFGDSKDGRINLLDIVNRLVEIDHDASLHNRNRSYYAQKNACPEFDEAFENRRQDAGAFWVWVEKELSVFTTKKWGAISKHISEFIRN